MSLIFHLARKKERWKGVGDDYKQTKVKCDYHVGPCLFT